MKKRLKGKALSLSPLADFSGVILWVVLAIFACIALASCASLSGSPAQFPKDPKKFYRRDMKVLVDGVEYQGYGTLPHKDSLTIEVRVKHDMDRFSATNCHKQIVEEKVDGTNMFSKTAKYKFVYERKTAIEKQDPCVLTLVASADGNEHSWAFFDFQDGVHLLKAHIQCDGWQSDSNGVSVCQSKAGLVQQISFDEEVLTDDESLKLPTHDNKTFMFEMPHGLNVFIFCNQRAVCHRLTTLGYDEAWLRERKQ